METQFSYSELITRLEAGEELSEAEQVFVLTMLQKVAPNTELPSPISEDGEVRLVTHLASEHKQPTIRLVTRL